MQVSSHSNCHHNNIDKQKWDACITNANNGVVYAYSFYLDAMAKNWEALVLNDYEMVMPLTYNKKYGIYYLYQPPFCAQLGVFGNELTKEIVEKFIATIPLKYKYWDVYLNYKKIYHTHKKISFFLLYTYSLSLKVPSRSYKSGYVLAISYSLLPCSLILTLSNVVEYPMCL